MRTLIYFSILASSLMACQTSDSEKVDYEALPAMNDEGYINAVIEIPAGTNHKIEYRADDQSFPVDQRDGKDRVIAFLPYPGNYGFIPSTKVDAQTGGDGDALDVLVLCEALPTGTVLEVRPIAALRLLDGGEIDTKIIAIPADTSLWTLPATDFRAWSIEYEGARHIVENWFLYYDGLGTNQFKGWEDEQYARDLVVEWSL